MNLQMALIDMFVFMVLVLFYLLFVLHVSSDDVVPLAGQEGLVNGLCVFPSTPRFLIHEGRALARSWKKDEQTMF